MNRKALALALLALAVRVPGLTKSLWLDEGFSLSSAHRLLAFDMQRPLYFLFLRGWMRVSQSEVWLRIPSMLAGVAAVVLTYELCRRCFSERVGLTAALLMALSSSQIEHSQEVRMYTIAPFLLLVSAAMLLSWHQKRRPLLLVLHALCGYLAMLAFVPCALGYGAMVLVALWKLRDRRRDLFVSAALVGCAWLPFLWVGLRHPEGTSWLPPTSPSDLLTIHRWALFSMAPYLLRVPETIPRHTMRVAVLVISALSCLGTVSSPKGRILGAWLYTILGFLLMVSLLVRPVWFPRYLMPFMPALFALIALGLERIRIQAPILAGAIAIALIATEGATRLATMALGTTVEDWKQAAHYVHQRAGGEPVGVFGAYPLDTTAASIGVWGYYYDGPTTYLDDVPSGDPHVQWLIVRSSSPGLRGEGRQRLTASLMGRGARWTEFSGVDVFEMPTNMASVKNTDMSSHVGVGF